ncbi:MAG: hypothetical protein IJ514_04500 [Clostridia bacterium]|nr:hypothetical protein [Clostridia bacterium]
MKKYAVIDIGSNSVRLMFVANGKVLYKRLNTTRLGEGIAARPRLKAEAIERSAVAVEAFYRQAQAEGAESVFAFATAAVRSTENGAEFVSRVKELCGLEVEVVSGETEAEIGVLGAFGNADGALIDIGGASTELVVRKRGKFVYKKSVDIGAVRLKDICGGNGEALAAFCERAVGAFGQVPAPSKVYAVGGTATTIAALVLGLEEYDSNKITGARITREGLSALLRRLLSMTVEEIAALPCMPKGRADIVTGGVIWLDELMKAFAIPEIFVSDRDNLEGYALKKGLTV